VLTVGFVITGEGAKTVLIRGVGPTLASYGVTDTLAKPHLRLFNSIGAEIATTTRWNSELTPVFKSVGAFDLPWGSNDAVLFFALPAGAYTAQLRGAAETVGTALVEVYAVEQSPVSFVTLEPVTAAAAESPVDAGAGALSPGPDASPVPKSRTPPQYPFSLIRANITGEALVDFYVMSDGTVSNAVAIKATDIRFGWSAVAAVQQWIFEPGRKDGKRVTTHMQQPISFSIAEGQ
jgi:TonB family protein